MKMWTLNELNNYIKSIDKRLYVRTSEHNIYVFYKWEEICKTSIAPKILFPDYKRYLKQWIFNIDYPILSKILYISKELLHPNRIYNRYKKWIKLF